MIQTKSSLLISMTPEIMLSIDSFEVADNYLPQTTVVTTVVLTRGLLRVIRLTSGFIATLTRDFVFVLHTVQPVFIVLFLFSFVIFFAFSVTQRMQKMTLNSSASSGWSSEWSSSSDEQRQWKMCFSDSDIGLRQGMLLTFDHGPSKVMPCFARSKPITLVVTLVSAEGVQYCCGWRIVMVWRQRRVRACHN